MRHLNAGRKLSRNTSHRRALLRNLVTSFLEHGRLMTTLPKAKEIRPLAEKMITLGKRDTLHARRQVQAYLLKETIAKKVFSTIAPKFAERNGGYSRIIKLGNRKGDGADVAIIELLGSELSERKAEAEAGAKPEKKSKDKAGDKGDGKSKSKGRKDAKE
jgi:large subunit ribosomal protein L17